MRHFFLDALALEDPKNWQQPRTAKISVVSYYSALEAGLY